MRRYNSWCLVLTGCVSLIGAGGCQKSGLAVAFVEGVVMLDGQPLEGASVGFSPLAAGQPAFGKTDATGVFHMTTVRGGARDRGAVVGEYAVTIAKWRNRMEGMTEPNPSLELELSKLPPDYIVPKAYGTKGTSGLKATVKPGHNVGPEFRFELQSDFKGG
jgi:hypothetical protein